MNKTQNISIASLPVIIDDDAYQLLKKYLDNISTKFKDDDLSELQKDVEVRILELLSDQGWKKESSIYKLQIVACIDQIGELEDFEETPKTDSEDARNLADKKLFRDTKNGQIFGVCQGIGEYFGVDPVWVRLVFIILSFLNGVGIGLYLIMAIIIPEAKTEFDRSRMRGEPAKLESIAKDLGGNISEVIERKAIAKKLNSFFKIITRLASKVMVTLYKIACRLVQASAILAAIALPLVVLPWAWLTSYQKELNLLPELLNLNEKIGITVFTISASVFFVIIFIMLSALFGKRPNSSKKIKTTGLALLVWVAVFASTIPYHSIWSEKFNNRMSKVTESVNINDKRISFEVNQESIDIIPNLPIGYSLNFSEDDKLHIVYNLYNSKTGDVFDYQEGELKGKVLKPGEQYKALDCKTCSNFSGSATIYIPRKVTSINILDVNSEEAINESFVSPVTFTDNQIYLEDFKNMSNLVNNRSSFYNIVGTYPETICEYGRECYLNPEFNNNTN